MDTERMLAQTRLMIFDKDGTLIDFHAMWAEWAQTLFDRLSRESGHDLRAALADAFGCERTTGRAMPERPLAVASMAALYDLTIEVMRRHGIDTGAEIAARCWFIPDARHVTPLCDLHALFSRIRARGCQIAVITSDDEAPTLTTLAQLGVQDMVGLVIAADSGFGNKPDPQAIIHACEHLGVSAGECAMVGDSAVDLHMARSAGVLSVGVLSGLGTYAILEPLADLMLPSVAVLLT